MRKPRNEKQLLVGVIIDELRDSSYYRKKELARIIELAKEGADSDLFDALEQYAHGMKMSAERVDSLAHSYVSTRLREYEKQQKKTS